MMIDKTQAIPDGYQSVNIYIVVKKAAEAIHFYKQAFGAVEKSRYEFPDSRILFSELLIGNSTIQISDEFSEREVKVFSPHSLNGTCCVIHLFVDDAEATFLSALNAGATLVRKLDHTFWGDLYGQVQDPYGHIWSIATRVTQVHPDEIKNKVAELIEQSRG
jgi:PhnB protein